MFYTNYVYITNKEDFIKPIQYMNDFPNINPMPFNTGVYTHKPITYKHVYTFTVRPITPQSTSSRYANRN